MKEEEIKKLLNDYNNQFSGCWSHNFVSIQNAIDKLREDNKKEREDLLMRAINAETKLKLYESLFSKLNLNMEVKNESA